MKIFRTFLPVILSGLIACAPLKTLCADNDENPSWFSFRYLAPAWILATAAITAGLFLWKYRHKLSHSKKPTILLNQSISVGSSECKGASRTWSKDVTVKQLKVQNQLGASCGYHALKNTILIANELTAPSTRLNDNLHNTQLINELFGTGNNEGTWRTMVLERQNNPYSSDTEFDGEMVRGDALDYLIKHELEQREFLHPEVHVAIDTIDDTSVIGLQSAAIHKDRKNESVVDYVTPRVKANLAKALAAKKPYLHGFLVNGSGHWIAVVLHQKPNGNREYIITDSINTVHLHDERVNKLIAAIENHS